MQTFPVQRLVTALVAAPNFEAAADIALAHLLGVLGAHAVDAPRALMQLHRGRNFVASSDPRATISSTALRMVRQSGQAVLVDVQAERLHHWRTGFEPGETITLLDFRSQAIIARRATHLLALPLRHSPTAIDGAVVLELNLSQPSGLDRAVPVLQAMADVMAVMLPQHAPARRPVLPGPIPVVGPTMEGFLSDLLPHARSADPLLIEGAPGVGKRQIAQWIHEQSPRKRTPTRSWHSAPEPCAGASLVGWAAGYSAEHPEATPGLLEQVKNGSLFIDRIETIALPVQAELVEIITQQRYRRLGETRARPAMARIICGTQHRAGLLAAIEAGAFNRTLFEHIDWLPLEVPSLSARVEDIDGWARHYLRGLAGQSAPAQLTVGASAYLGQLPWPDNLRGLLRVLKRALHLAESSGQMPLTITAQHIRVAAAQGDAPQVALDAVLRDAARHFVDAASARAEVGLAEARVFEHYVVTMAEARHGKLGALGVLNKSKEASGANHHRRFRAAHKGIAAFEARSAELGEEHP
jgi:DNA-binding NtrC family response regulator